MLTASNLFYRYFKESYEFKTETKLLSRIYFDITLKCVSHYDL